MLGQRADGLYELSFLLELADAKAVPEAPASGADPEIPEYLVVEEETSV